MKSTAYHEASHAVLAYITGVYHMEGIDLRGAERAWAGVRRDLRFSAAREIANKGLRINHDLEEAIIAAAGSEGQRRYIAIQGRKLDDLALSKGAAGDKEEVEKLLGPDQWDRVCARAAFYLGQPKIWGLVQMLAAELLKQEGVLSGDHMSGLLYRACVDADLPECQVLQ